MRVSPRRFKIHALLALSAPLLTLISSSFAQADDLKLPVDNLAPIKWSAFVDSYYGYDFNTPSDHERAVVTQAKRSNEFNINLAYLDASVNADRWRARLALQAGTSVKANYASEPTEGSTSGASLARNLQEAYAGYKVTDKLWIDAGIMFSYIGSENWVSWNNWNYTRSLDAELTPYYQTGVRATYLLNDQLSAQVNVMNGWQNISENNNNKALGVQVAYTPNSTFTFTYNDFFGQEFAANGYMSERYFNQLIAQWNVNSKLQLSLTGDVGFQALTATAGVSNWWDATLLARYPLTQSLNIGARAEYYSDPNQVMVATATPNGFQTWGVSVNVDDQLNKWLLWRSEFRWLQATNSVFPGSSGNSKNDPLFVSSLAFKI